MAQQTTRRELVAPLSATRVQAIYTRIGRRYDWLRVAEATPKRAALDLLAVRPGERVLEVGVGTGAVLVELARAASGRMEGDGQAALHTDTIITEPNTQRLPLVSGIDLTPEMARLASERIRTAGLADVAAVAVGDALALPYPDASFDAAFTSYVLDLLPAEGIARALGELGRVLRPGGRLALVALAPGRGLGARLFTTAYEALYRLSPAALAGCRPIALAAHVAAAGFTVEAQRSYFRVHPSDVVLAKKPDGDI